MKIRIGTKLGAGFASVLLMTTAIGYFGVQALSTSNRQLDQFTQRPFEQVQALGGISASLEAMRRYARNTMAEPTPEAKAVQLKQYGEAWTRMMASMDRYEAAVQTQEGELAMAELHPSIVALRPVADQIMADAMLVDPNEARLSAEAERLSERAAFFRTSEAGVDARPERSTQRQNAVRALQERVETFGAAHGRKARPVASTDAKGVDLDLNGGFERLSA